MFWDCGLRYRNPMVPDVHRGPRDLQKPLYTSTRSFQRLAKPVNASCYIQTGNIIQSIIMALPLPPGLTPPEIGFLCEMELVTVIPRQRLEGLELLGVSPAYTN